VGNELFTLAILAIPVATIAWTVTHEELFRELRERCKLKSETCRTLMQRKMFYLITCEFCFSFYVAVAFAALARFRLLFLDWRGYLIAVLSLVWVANIYMSVYARLRLDIKKERIEISSEERRSESTRPRARAGT
jgi:hypothetical protein